MRVREGSPDDFDAVATLLVRAYQAAWGPSGWDEYRAELIDVAGRAEHCFTYVAQSGDLLVGTVAVVSPDSPMRKIADSSALELRMLAVDPDARRSGAATALVRACADRAAALSLRSLVLQSDEDLIEAHAFYEALGFRRRSDFDVRVGDGYRALGYELAVGSAPRSDS